MNDDEKNVGNKKEETFLVARRWDDLDLIEKAKIQEEREAYAGLPEAQREYVQRMIKLSRRHYLGKD